MLAAAASSTRKSSTCQPGSVLVRYSEMLLLSLPWLVAGAGGGAAPQQKLALLFSSSDGGGGDGQAAGSAERRTPVSRNRVWRMVSSLAVCTDTSQSRHRIARSSLQNRRPLFSCKQRDHKHGAQSDQNNTHRAWAVVAIGAAIG